MKALEFTVGVYLLPFIRRTREYGGPKHLRIWFRAEGLYRKDTSPLRL